MSSPGCEFNVVVCYYVEGDKEKIQIETITFDKDNEWQEIIRNNKPLCCIINKMLSVIQNLLSFSTTVFTRELS